MKTSMIIFFIFLFSVSFSQSESIKCEKKILNENKIKKPEKKAGKIVNTNNEESQPSGIVKPPLIIIYQDEEKIQVQPN